MERTHDKQSRRVSSFGAAMREVEAQVGLAGLIEEKEIYEEIGRVIADVYCRRTSDMVNVDGHFVSNGYLSELFRSLTDDHLRQVAEAVETYPRTIKFKKAFIRTALYNSLFELRTGVANRVNLDMKYR